MCGVQVFFIIVEHGIYTGGVWYMIAVAWLLLTGLFIYKYIAAVRDEKEEAKRIAEFKEKYKIKVSENTEKITNPGHKKVYRLYDK